MLPRRPAVERSGSAAIGGSIRCFSGGGLIQVDRAGKESWLETAGGDIFVRESGGPHPHVDCRWKHPDPARGRHGIGADIRWTDRSPSSERDRAGG